MESALIAMGAASLTVIGGGFTLIWNRMNRVEEKQSERSGLIFGEIRGIRERLAHIEAIINGKKEQ